MKNTPHQTGCTKIDFPDVGTTNGFLSMMESEYDVVYDDEDDIYRVYESRQGPAKSAVETNRGP